MEMRLTELFLENNSHTRAYVIYMNLKALYTYHDS